jgi:hypothetical protein
MGSAACDVTAEAALLLCASCVTTGVQRCDSLRSLGPSRTGSSNARWKNTDTSVPQGPWAEIRERRAGRNG